MTEPILKQEILNELNLACTALNRILGIEALIQPDEFVNAFCTKEKIEDLSHSGLSIEQIKDTLAQHADSKKAIDVSSTTIIANGISAFWRWARIGFGLVDPKQFEARIVACNECENLIDMPSIQLYKILHRTNKPAKVCSKCGCMVDKKARLVSENCPLKHPVLHGLSRWSEPLHME